VSDLFNYSAFSYDLCKRAFGFDEECVFLLDDSLSRQTDRLVGRPTGRAYSA